LFSSRILTDFDRGGIAAAHFDHVFIGRLRGRFGGVRVVRQQQIIRCRLELNHKSFVVGIRALRQLRGVTVIAIAIIQFNGDTGRVVEEKQRIEC